MNKSNQPGCSNHVASRVLKLPQLYTLDITTVKAKQEEAITHFALGETCSLHCPPDMERVSATKLFRCFFDCLGKVEKKSIVMVVSPLVTLIGSNEGPGS